MRQRARTRPGTGIRELDEFAQRIVTCSLKYAPFSYRIDLHRTHSACEAEPRSWVLLQDDEMIIPQITGKMFYGDPPATSNETLEARVAAVDVLNMESATNAFSG